jgi:transposase
MLNLPPSVRIYLCVQPTDMRKGFDSLAMMVREYFGCDPLSGHLFVFAAKGHGRVKLLWWDRDGFAIIYKRLEQGTFKFPRAMNNDIKALEIDATDMMALLSGFELVKVKRQLRYYREAESVVTVTSPAQSMQAIG